MALDLGELVGRLRIDPRQWDKGLDDAESGFKGLGNRITTLATVAGTAAALAFGVALIGAMDEQDVGFKVAAQLGRSAEEAERLGHVAGKIYADNFGESVADVGDALTKVMRAGLVPEDAGEDVLADMTSRALVLRDVFQQDLGRSINAVQQILRNGLAPDAETAFDLIARGVQEGVDKSEDLLDTFNEYSTQFRELGLSGQQALGLMSQGLKAGARDADTVADALKEFAIRAKDSSKLSREGFAAVGLNADQMFKIFSRGGPNAAAALGDVITRLKAMKDPIAQDTAAVALFGTKAEDLQDALFALDPSTAAAAIGNLEGAVDRAAETAAGSASANIESFKRQLEVAFVQTLGAKVIPAVTEAAKWLSQNFGPALKTTAEWIKQNQEWLGPLAVALGTFVGIITAITLAMRIWTAVTAAYTAVQLLLNGALTANPIGIIVVAIAALVAGLIYAYKNSETFRRVVDATFKGIATVAKWLWNNILKPAFTAIVGYYKMWATIAMWVWRNVLSPVFRFIGAAFGVFMQNLKSAGALFMWLGRTIIGPIIQAIIGYFQMWGAIFGWLWNNAINPVIKAIGAAIGWVWSTIISPIFNKIVGIVSKVGNTFKSVFSKIAGFVTSAFSTAVGVAKGAINGLIGLLNKAIGFINRHLVGNLNKVPGVNFSSIPTLPKLARGGAVHPSPGGRPVVMGDGGQVEYGVPHDDMERIIDRAVSAGSGGQMTVEVVVMDEMRRVRKKTRVQGAKSGTNRVVPVLVGG